VSTFLVIVNANDPSILDTIEQSDGEVISIYDPAVLLVDGDDTTHDAVAALKGAGVLELSDLDSALDASQLGLDDESAAAVDAWNLRQDPSFIDAMNNRPRDGEDWETPPDGCVQDIEGGEA